VLAGKTFVFAGKTFVFAGKTFVLAGKTFVLAGKIGLSKAGNSGLSRSSNYTNCF